MGIGALYVRRRPRARLSPLVFGGGQERALRSGTVPLPLAVGFSVAAVESVGLQKAEAARLAPIKLGLKNKYSSAFRQP